MQTALYPKHVALGAKIVDFAGWEMPIHYSKGILHEHQTVRQHVGIFDVSHMGKIHVSGKGAEALLDFLSTNNVSNKSDFSTTYTVWCEENGGSIDDLLIYRCSPIEFFVIANASNRQKDLAHLKKHAQRFDVKVEDHFATDGILAVQGPKAQLLVERLFPQAKDIQSMHFSIVEYNGKQIVLSRTGYTGSGGFELMGPHEAIVDLWEWFLENGKSEQIEPIGLGARDTLRLEMGYALYGHELDGTIAPTESVATWTVKLKKDAFIGKEALEKLTKSAHKRKAYGIVLQDKGIAREGYPIYDKEKWIGKVTSGTFAPSLNQAIAMIIVEGALTIGQVVEVGIREHKVKAEVVGLPFLKKE